MKIFSLTIDIRMSSHWKVLSVSLTRLTRTSLLNRKSYSGGTLDWYIFGSNICKWLIPTGRLKVQINSKALANCERPKCDVCDFGKAHFRSNKVNTINSNHMKEQDLQKDHLLPGNMVSEYHYISWSSGRLYHTTVKSDPYEMFSGGCFYWPCQWLCEHQSPSVYKHYWNCQGKTHILEGVSKSGSGDQGIAHW